MSSMRFKQIFCGVMVIIGLTGMIVYIYQEGSVILWDIIKKEDYLYYDFKIVPLFLLLPAMIVADFFFITLLLPFRKKTDILIQKIYAPTWLYTLAAFSIGLMMSFVISIYPLSTDYYKCKSTSIVSSGSHYAKSKAICKQRAYSPAPQAAVTSRSLTTTTPQAKVAV